MSVARRTARARHERPVQDPNAEFRDAVVAGLRSTPRTIPCRFLYDDRGSALFEAITELDEYYPTRTETGILQDHRDAIAARIPAGAVLVELGSGSSSKTEILLGAVAGRLAAYVPVDISPAALDAAAERLAARHPSLRVRPLVADFSAPLPLPRELAAKPAVGFFPGSTIGNLERDEAVRLLAALRQSLGPSACLVIGVDLRKDASILLPAYNDAQGVTAAFNLNLLRRSNRELGTDFDLDAWRHEATWDARVGRIEMHLVSLREQEVVLGGDTFAFAAGETIRTERSHKYDVAEFARLAARAGWASAEVWCDAARLFSVHALVAPDA